MIESTIIAYLNSVLSVPVYAEEPEKKPDAYVIVEKTSSGRENYINSCVVALQSYGTTMANAAQLNEQVKDAMDSAITLPNISRSKLNSDYNYTNTQTKQYRYQAVYDLVFFN